MSSRDPHLLEAAELLRQTPDESRWRWLRRQWLDRDQQSQPAAPSTSGQGEKDAAVNDDTENPPVCAACGADYHMEAGEEPTKYCDSCAHERVESAEREAAEVKGDAMVVAHDLQSVCHHYHLERSPRTAQAVARILTKEASAPATEQAVYPDDLLAECSYGGCHDTGRIEGLCVAHFKQKEGERALFAAGRDIEASGLKPNPAPQPSAPPDLPGGHGPTEALRREIVEALRSDQPKNDIGFFLLRIADRLERKDR